MEELLKKNLKIFNPTLEFKKLDIKNLVFEERVKLLCFHCEKYNQSFTCPPRIPNLDYKKIVNEFNNCAVVFCSMNCNQSDFHQIRLKSTLLLHKGLLKLEDILRKNNYPVILSFIGGSCKLCKGGCSGEKCRNPYLARIPIEAAGINIIDSLKSIGINVKFPIKDVLNRYGLIFW